MKNGPLLFLGLLLAFVISFAGVVIGSHGQIGRLAPWFDEGDGAAFPQRVSGLAARGQLVYADLGCAACHTQQVRRPDLGSDKARGWGDRQSVARDYIHQARPQLGASRIGPDLANVGARWKDKGEAALFALLLDGSAQHPAYKFLFEPRAPAVEPAPRALKAAVSGESVVPTERARSLVAYLLSLNTAYDYPEARPVVADAKKKEGHE